MKLYVIRHGESENNVKECFTGWMDVDPTEKGIADAQKAGKLLEGVSFDRIYASDLRRAMDTAKSAIPGCTPIPEPLLREISVGIATPATPHFRTKMQKALPATLMTFISRLASMDTLLLPTLR